MSRSRLVLVSVAAIAVAACLVGTGAALAAAAPAPPAPPGANAPPNAPAQVVGSAHVPLVPPVLNTLYVPITPCRIVDTRSAGGRVQAGQTRSFKARGTTGFTAQGGLAAGCGIPGAATSITVAVSATNIAGTGYFRTWPYGQTPPNATIAHYIAGPISTTGGTITLGAGSYDFSLEAFGAGASPVIDATGYFAPQMAAYVAEDGTLVSATPRVLSVSHPSAGNYIVTFDSDVSLCSFLVTPYAFNYTVAVGPNNGVPTQARVFIHDEAAGHTPHDDTFFIQATC